MKRLFLSLSAILIAQAALAVTHHIVIDSKNLVYLPNILQAAIGDSVIIEASPDHPLVQVDQNTWNANGTAPMAGGWGVQMSDYSFVVGPGGDIYYVCQQHADHGMKGKIEVQITGVAENAALPEVKLFPTYVTNGSFSVNVANIKTKDQPVLSVYNLAGQLTESYVLGKAQNVFDTNLPPGIYIYTVGNAANTNVYKTGKFVITK